MVKTLTPEMKVGLFAAAIIVVLAWATLRVSDKTTVHGGGYTIKAAFDNATGLKLKAPVELAGVQVGVIKNIELQGSRQALVTIALKKSVRLPGDSKAVLRTRGFLGETYVELIPGTPELPALSSGEEIFDTMRTGDINSLVSQFNSIAEDIKQITSTLRTTVGEGEASPVNQIVKNLDEFTRSIRDVTLRNEGNIDRIAANLAAMTDQLRQIVARGEANLDESMERIASITRKIDEGRGTVGKLVNDEETIDKLNEAVDGLNETVGGFRRMEAEIGYHAEYLANTRDFKNYVSLALRPSPDKAFLLDLVSDPNPRPTHVVKTSNVTVGGATTTVQTDTATVDRNKLRISAQLAKKFYDFTIRGGIIESTGGFGVDYEKGPLGLQFSAFDFSTRYGERPHLKAMGLLNVTRNFYLVGGVDDFISKQGERSGFAGAGFRLVDDDIKSILAGGAAKSLVGK
ncbi:MAG TPA: MlaD family protein [bacterium]|nr:MlaD family protein [bacterium]